MKKQFFTLVMMLAIVVFAGSSAWGQNSPIAAEVQFTGATKTFSVTNVSGNYYEWNLYKVTNVAGAAYPFTYDLTAAVAATDANIVTEASAVDNNSFTLQWDENAAGLYCVEVIEDGRSNTVGTTHCTTVRHFFVNIVDIDITVYACNESGDSIGGDNLNHCGPDYDPFSNSVGADLETYAAANPRQDTSYVAVLVRSTNAAIDISGFDWRFNWTLAGQHMDDIPGLPIVAQVPATTAVTATATAGTSTTGVVTVEHGSNKIVLMVLTDKRFGTVADNTQFTFDVNSNTAMLHLDTDADGLFNDGTESTARYTLSQNTSAMQTIVASPNTSQIGSAN